MSTLTQAQCLCLKSIQSASCQPILQLKGSSIKNTLMVCGDLKSKLDDNHIILSEFEVFQPGETSPLLSFDTLPTFNRTFDIQIIDSKLVIVEMTRWPVGADYKWINIPFMKYVIETAPRINISKQLIIEPSKHTTVNIAKALHLYQTYQGHKKIEIEDQEILIGNILIAALAGNKQAQIDFEKILEQISIEKGYPFRLYMEALRLYNICLGTSIKARPLRPSCFCPGNIAGGAGDKPLMVIKQNKDKGGLVVCGYPESQKDKNHITASEFEVFKCGASEPLLMYGALQKCDLNRTGSKLIITELITWPFSPNLEWIDVPFEELTVDIEHDFNISSKFVLKPPHYDKSRVKEILENYEFYLGKNFRHIDLYTTENLIGAVLGCALMGNQQAQQYLEQMNANFDLGVHDSEMYDDAIMVYRAYKEAVK